ncbi:hypothetical protein ACKKBG_A03465 [Auxenochlorella protothecoides x Auxenochlorella symbiontica]
MVQTRSVAARGGSQDEAEVLDPSTKFLYSPHTLTVLLAAIVGLIAWARPFNPPDTPSDPATAASLDYQHAKNGIWAVVYAFLIISTVQGPDTKMIRPHPAFWRFVFGLVTCYTLFMVYLLFQSADGARQTLKHLYPELGVELDERHYGTDCALYKPGQGINWEVINDTVFDEFVVAHILGWWGKTLMLRDRTMLWIISIGFELMEVTFQHWLPNFNECWWDSWILDVAICNNLGIALGMWSISYFDSKEYDWRGMSQQPSLLAKARRSLLQFTPKSFSNLKWQAFASPKRCLQCLFPIAVFLLFEVNHFFLKFVLWVPPSNPLNPIRLFLLLGVGLPGMRECYEYIEASGSPQGADMLKLGAFAWLGLALALVETLVSIKFGKGMFPAPWPTHILIGWGLAAACGLTLFTVWSLRYYSRQRAGTKAKAA